MFVVWGEKFDVWYVRVLCGVYVCDMVLCNHGLVWLISLIVLDRAVVWCFRHVVWCVCGVVWCFRCVVWCFLGVVWCVGGLG